MKSETPPNLVLSFVMSRACNIRCKFCYQDGFDATRVSDNVLFNELAPIYPRTRFLAIVGGEITVIKGMKAYLKFISKTYPHITILIGTNGVLFDSEWIELCLECNILVNYSLNATSAENYKKVLMSGNYKDIYQEIYNNLLKSRKIEEKTGKQIINNISMVITEDTLTDVTPFALLALKLGVNPMFRFTIDKELAQNILELENKLYMLKYYFEDYIFLKLWHNPSYRNEKKIMIDVKNKYASEKQEFLSSLDFNPKKSLSKSILTFEEFFTSENGECGIPGNYIAVTADNYAVPCYNLPNFVLGNINHGDIQKIIDGKDMKKIIDLVSNGDYRYCFERCPEVRNPTTCIKNLSHIPEKGDFQKYFDKGDYADATKILEEIVGTGMFAPHECYCYAFSLHMLRDYEKAIKYYTLALDVGFSEFWTLYNRAAALESLGKYDEAYADINRAIELDDSHDGAKEILKRLEIQE